MKGVLRLKSYKILLGCVSGMSTSMVVNYMKRASIKYDFPIEISYTIESDIESEAIHYDLVMLGPQLRTSRRRFEKKLSKYHIPVIAIPVALFSDMEGEKILDYAIEQIDNYRKGRENK